MTSRGRIIADMALKVNSDRESIEKRAAEPEEVCCPNLKNKVELHGMVINEEFNVETKTKGNYYPIISPSILLQHFNNGYFP